jgi:MATE family multidrug resistance protein
MTESYLRILSFGLVAYSINWTLTTWLQAIGMSDVPPYASAVGLGLHIPFTYLFIFVFDWGYLGCAVATVAFYTIQPLMLIAYVFLLPVGRARVGEAIGLKDTAMSLPFWREVHAGIGSLAGIKQYLSLAVPGLVAISEWWASEVCIVFSGRLHPSPELALGAMTIFQSVNTLCFMFPASFSIAGAARVGSLLGAQDCNAAAFASNVSLVFTGSVSALIGCTLYVLPHSYFPSIFAPTSVDLIHEASLTIPFLALYVFGDAMASAFNGIIKGCGRQKEAAPVVLIAYWMIGVPLAYCVTFSRHQGALHCGNGSHFCGNSGLLLGMTVGTWIHMILLGSTVLFTTNWKQEQRKAIQRNRKDKR